MATGGAVEPDVVVDGHASALRAHQPCDDAQSRRLPRAGRTDERDGRADVEAQLEVERPKRDTDLFESERCHESPRWRPARRTMLKRTSAPPIARAASKPSGRLNCA